MKIGMLLLATLLLSGCATKAYRAVESECAPQAWADYPENKVQVLQTRQRVIHVSTGMRSCFSTRDGAHISTICNDITRPELGGKITAVLDGTEGQAMFDNITVGADGRVTLQEDVGNNPRLGKVWQYDPVTDKLTELAAHDPARFLTGGSDFRTQDEESSGIIDVTATFGDADHKAYLLDVQNHAVATLLNSGANFATLVEGGQLLLMKVALNAPVITSNAGGATASISVGENSTAVTTARRWSPSTVVAHMTDRRDRACP